MASGIINIAQSVEGCSGRKQHKHNGTEQLAMLWWLPQWTVAELQQLLLPSKQ